MMTFFEIVSGNRMVIVPQILEQPPFFLVQIYNKLFQSEFINFLYHHRGLGG